MSQFDDSGESVANPAGAADEVEPGTAVEDAAVDDDASAAEPAAVEPADTPVAAALRELDTLSERELAEHPDVYQRIHGELQSALAAIDNA